MYGLPHMSIKRLFTQSYRCMSTLEKDHKDDKDLPIRLRLEEVPEEQVKRSWDAIYKAITELEEKKAGSNKKPPTQS